MAIVMVMVVIAIILVISNDFGSSTGTDVIAAANYRDQMRADFLARSALNFGELVIRIQQRLDNVKAMRGLFQITDYADQLMLPFCGSPEEVVAAIGPLAFLGKGFGADIGTCGTGAIMTDDDKINLNCANTASWATIKAALDAMMFFNAYDPVFDDNDAEGYHRDRATQSAAIIDFIDSDGMHLRDRGTTEDYGYDTLKDPYYPKIAPAPNNQSPGNGYYLDSVGEIKLARGVDDRFWQLFGSAFTVYGGCRVNLSTASNVQLIAAILFLAAKNPNDPVILDQRRLFLLAGEVAKAKNFGESFLSLDDFITFVKDPSATVSALASQSGTMAGSAASAAVAQGLPGLAGGDKVGLELDKGKLTQIATTGPRRTYRIQAYGQVDRKQLKKDGSPVYPPIRSTITGVWDTKVVPQNARKTPVPNGAWVFLRED